MPSEIVLPAAGIWVAQGKFGSNIGGFLIALLAVMAGSMIGASLSYAIGYYGGMPLLKRVGRIFRITPEKLDASEAWIRRHGSWAIAAGRLMFGVRHAQSLVAGSLRMSFRAFLAFTFLGCAIWNTLGVCLGYRYQEHIRAWLNRIGLGTFAAAIVVALLFWGYSRWQHGQKDRTGGA